MRELVIKKILSGAALAFKDLDANSERAKLEGLSDDTLLQKLLCYCEAGYVVSFRV